MQRQAIRLVVNGEGSSFSHQHLDFCPSQLLVILCCGGLVWHLENPALTYSLFWYSSATQYDAVQGERTRNTISTSEGPISVLLVGQNFNQSFKCDHPCGNALRVHAILWGSSLYDGSESPCLFVAEFHKGWFLFTNEIIELNLEDALLEGELRNQNYSTDVLIRRMDFFIPRHFVQCRLKWGSPLHLWKWFSLYLFSTVDAMMDKAGWARQTRVNGWFLHQAISNKHLEEGICSIQSSKVLTI